MVVSLLFATHNNIYQISERYKHNNKQYTDKNTYQYAAVFLIIVILLPKLSHTLYINVSLSYVKQIGCAKVLEYKGVFYLYNYGRRNKKIAVNAM